MGQLVLKSFLMVNLVSVAAEGSAAQDARPASSEVGDQRSSDRVTLEQFRRFSHIQGSRKIDIAPIRPANGIDNGMVMAYGHIIPPPYEIELKGERLFINGVQVKPSLFSERLETGPQVKMASPRERAVGRKVEQLRREVAAIYRSPQRKDSREKILALLNENKDVIQDARWRDDELCFYLAGKRGLRCWSFDDSVIRSLERVEQNVRNILADDKARIERDLRAGAFLIFDARGQHGRANDPRREVNLIMSQPGLSPDQRIEKLKEVFGGYATAIEVHDNYRQEEWKVR